METYKFKLEFSLNEIDLSDIYWALLDRQQTFFVRSCEARSDEKKEYYKARYNRMEELCEAFDKEYKKIKK